MTQLCCTQIGNHFVPPMRVFPDIIIHPASVSIWLLSSCVQLFVMKKESQFFWRSYIKGRIAGTCAGRYSASLRFGRNLAVSSSVVTFSVFVYTNTLVLLFSYAHSIFRENCARIRAIPLLEWSLRSAVFLLPPSTPPPGHDISSRQDMSAGPGMLHIDTWMQQRTTALPSTTKERQ